MIQIQFVSGWHSFSLHAYQSQLGARDSIVVSFFTLLPIDDVPNLIEVLITWAGAGQCSVSQTYIVTHRTPGIEVLQVVRVLPNIDANDGYMSEKRVLIGCGDDLENLRLGIQALPRGEKRDRHHCEEHTSQPQPDP